MYQISEKLLKCTKFITTEIKRKCQSLGTIWLWKGAEFRTFLLKTGPIVLKEHLKSEAYNHFLSLDCALYKWIIAKIFGY